MKSLLVLAFSISSVLGLSIQSSANHRIVGGSDAPEGYFPYQVSLRTPENQHFCGASIIGDDWILTSAQCVYDKLSYSILAVVGTNDLFSGGTPYTVSEIIWHENFRPGTLINDIALLRVDTTISFNLRVRPIGLASADAPVGAFCVLTGWGFTSYPLGSPSNNLKVLANNILDLWECKNSLPGYVVTQTNVCTIQDFGTGACNGDFGGPLACGDLQYGIASWVIPCAQGKPDVYTSIAPYRLWIQHYTNI